tara:strand:+ start:437 stop:2035 length:1599 start_codon:yes stop_codon:yes gene_type:complete
MAEWWNQATDWLGDTFKPGGYTGALMDAGYLDWSDILGAAGRGLLDYGAQERARSAWRPINAPEPIVDPGRSFDLYNASIGNTVNQRAALQKLQSDAAMRKIFGDLLPGAAPVLPVTQTQVSPVTQTQVLPPAPALDPVLDRHITDPVIADVMAGVGQVDSAPASATIVPEHLYTPVSASPVSNPVVDMFGDMPPELRQYMGLVGSTNPTAAMQIWGNYLTGQANKEGSWHTLDMGDGNTQDVYLTDKQVRGLQQWAMENNVPSPITKYQAPLADKWAESGYFVDGVPFTGTRQELQALSQLRDPEGKLVHTITKPPQQTIMQTGQKLGFEAGKDWLADYSAAQKGIKGDHTRLADMQQLHSLLSHGLRTGWGTEVMTNAKKFLARFNPGFMESDAYKDVAGAEGFNSVALGVVGPMLKELGSNPTDADLKMQLARFPNWNTSTEGNRFIIELVARQAQRNIWVAEFQRKFVSNPENQALLKSDPLDFTLKYDREFAAQIAEHPLWRNPVPPPSDLNAVPVPEQFRGGRGNG